MQAQLFALGIEMQMNEAGLELRLLGSNESVKTVDAAMANGRSEKPLGEQGRPLVALEAFLEHRFRDDSGRNVDFSGSAQVELTDSGATCVPREMLRTLCAPWIIRELIDRGRATRVREALELIPEQDAVGDEVVARLLPERPLLFAGDGPTMAASLVRPWDGDSIRFDSGLAEALSLNDGDELIIQSTIDRRRD